MREVKTYQKQFTPSDAAGLRSFAKILKDLGISPHIIGAQTSSDQIRVQFDADPAMLTEIRRLFNSLNGHERANTTKGNAETPNAPNNFADFKKFSARYATTLSSKFDGFHQTQYREFNGAGSLNLNLACSVGIRQGTQNKIIVEIDADPRDLKNFSIFQQGGTVFVRQNGEMFSSEDVVIDGRSFSSFTSVRSSSMSFTSVNGNRVTINGQDVTPGQGGKRSTKPPRIFITAPADGDIEATMMGSSILFSLVPHNRALLNLYGTIKAGVAARQMKVRASGEINIEAMVGGGNFDVSLSGEKNVNAMGEFADVCAASSGNGNIRTEGTVRGAYKASASGTGSIRHLGKIMGNTKQHTSGQAKISLG